MPGSWPHGPNFYNAPATRSFPKPLPPIGLPRMLDGYMPGTPARFGGNPPRTYAAQWQGQMATPPARTLPEAAGCNPCDAGDAAPGGEFAYVTDSVSRTFAPPRVSSTGAGPAFGPGGPAPTMTAADRARLTRLGAAISGPGGMMGPASAPPTVIDTLGEPLDTPSMDDPSLQTTTVVEEPTASKDAKETPWAWIIGGSLAAIGVVGAVAYAVTRPKRKAG